MVNDPPPNDVPDWLLSRIADQDVVDFMEENAGAGVSTDPDDLPPGNRERKYAIAALESECAALAAATKGSRNHTLNVASVKLFELVAARLLSASEVEDALIQACKANGLVKDDGLTSVRATIKSGASFGIKHPRSVPNNNDDDGKANGGGAEQAEQDALPPAFSESALAMRFVEAHADDLRFVAGWGKWLRWDGRRWSFDTILHAYDQVHALCRQAAAECNRSRVAAMIATNKTVAAVERLARADPRIAATIDQWDADLWLLNTPAGIVDLRTGVLRPATPEDYCTKMTAVAPRKMACPLFDKFMDDILPEKRRDYVYRFLGYALTGVTTEQVFFFWWGEGGNGKSVLISTVSGIFSDYHKTAVIETFIVTNTPQHPTDLADLQGARLVTAIETEEGRRWAQARINTMTGGDKIKARFMRQNFFEYVPQFKLVIVGNKKPSAPAVDYALRRRFRLLAFPVKILEEKRDKDLVEKLKAEWPGILQRLIDGCLEWQQGGLGTPDEVVEATEEYLQGEDMIEAWIEDRCDRCQPIVENFESRTELFASWKTWAANAEEFVGTSKRFYQRLDSKGFHRHKKDGVRGYLGLKLKAPPY
jgi:putative DNA primase/helicase